MNNKGQTLIFILLIMTIALAIGVSISSSTISTVSRTTNVDNSARALAAAEAGLEYYLAQPYKVIFDLDSSNCGSGETTLRYPATGSLSNDLVMSYADVVIRKFGCLANGQTHIFDVYKDQTIELKLDDGTSAARQLHICWTYRGTPSSLYTFDINGAVNFYEMNKKGFNYPGYNTLPGNKFTPSVGATCIGPNGETVAGAQIGTNGLITTGSSPKILRITSIFGDSQIFITNRSGTNMPFQGFEIVSTGVVEAGAEKTQRTVTARRSRPYLPTLFNFGIYNGANTVL